MVRWISRSPPDEDSYLAESSSVHEKHGKKRISVYIPFGANGINLVNEDNAGCMIFGSSEHFTNELGAVPKVFLDQF